MFNLTTEHLQVMIELIRKYADLPMDLADASLWIASEALHTQSIATLDTDYDVYKSKKGKAFSNVLRKHL